MNRTTVVIPNYNGMAFLEDCMRALLASQEPGSFDILIVDNGSKDGSLALAEDYARDYAREKKTFISVLSYPENRGFCGAVNGGIKAIKTEFVLLLNNDTEVAENFVRELEACMDRHSDAFSAQAKMLCQKQPDIIDDCGDLYCALGWAFALGKGKYKSNYEKECRVFASCGGAVIYRMAYIEKIGAFDDNHFAYLEDMDIGYRARLHGYHNYFCPRAVVLHAGSGFSGSRYNRFKIDLSAQNSIYIIYKNMPLLQLLINLPFLFAGFFIKTLFFIKKGFGKTYLKGLAKGFKKSASAEGKKWKVRFCLHNLGHYGAVQLELWWNIIRRISG